VNGLLGKFGQVKWRFEEGKKLENDKTIVAIAAISRS
jgi:hypothetical protein